MIHLRKSALSCIWIISLSNIKFYQSLVRSPFPFDGWRLISYTASVLGIKEDSRIGIIQTLWNYIKLQGLQDKVDRRVIRADERLRPVSFISFQILLSIPMTFFFLKQDFRRRDRQLPKTSRHCEPIFGCPRSDNFALPDQPKCSTCRAALCLGR